MAICASRRSGGVVITTYAAATPAVTRTILATARAVRFSNYELRRGVPEVPVVELEGELVAVDMLLVASRT